MSYEIIEKLKKEIEGYKDRPEWAEVGRVIEVGDGIVKILGLRNAVSQEVLKDHNTERRADRVGLQLGRGIHWRARARRFFGDRGRQHREADRRVCRSRSAKSSSGASSIH